MNEDNYFNQQLNSWLDDQEKEDDTDSYEAWCEQQWKEKTER